jgi:RHS repeat-associated protein
VAWGHHRSRRHPGQEQKYDVPFSSTASNVINTIDPLGNTTTYQYDALNRQTQVIDAKSGITTTVYDGVGNVVNVIDAVGNKTTMVYDGLYREIQQIDPLGHSSTYAYDRDSRLISSTDRDGRLISYAYDGDSRLLGETWQSGGSTVNTLTYSYDNNGNMLTAANNAGTVTMTYDRLDRLATQQGPFGVLVTSTYDAAGNRTLLQDSFGGVLTSVYDAANRLTSRQFGGSGQTPLRMDLGYTVRDQIASETRYSDLAGTQLVGSSAYSYDGAERLTHLQHLNGSSSNLANYTYTYDLASRVTSETLNGTTTSYSYDATDQLTNDTTTTYSYDGTGNRTMTGYQTGTGNQLLNDGTWAYTFDSEGNEIKKSKGSSAETWTFGYDNQNHLLWAKGSATDGGSVLMLATYTYDALGDRIEKDVWTSSSGTTTVTRFAYDGSNVLADLDSSNTLQARYLRGDQPDQFFARITTGSGASWFLPDREGSIRDITDASGAVQDHIVYGGFGNITSESNASYGGRIKYTGLQADSETGFYFAINRYYDPQTGRWINVDPLGFGAGDSNLYRYVTNAPTNATDPTGLQQYSQSSGPGGGVTPGYGGGGGVPGQGGGLMGAKPPGSPQKYPNLGGMGGNGGSGLPQGAGLGARDPKKPPYSPPPLRRSPYDVWPSMRQMTRGEIAANAALDAGLIKFKWQYRYMRDNIDAGGLGFDPWVKFLGPQVDGNGVVWDIICVGGVLYAVRSRFEAHHQLPKEFRNQFAKARLDIEDYVIDLEKAAHRLKPGGLHTGAGAGNWNGAWREFFKRNPNASKQEILDQLAKMRKDFGLE